MIVPDIKMSRFQDVMVHWLEMVIVMMISTFQTASMMVVIVVDPVL